MHEIAIRPVGRMANQMMQYLVATRYAQKFPGARISGVALAEWNLPNEDISRGHHGWPKIDIQRFDVAYLDALIADGSIDRIKLRCPCGNVAAFPDRAVAQRLFELPEQEYRQTGEKDLVIHIRLGDIMQSGRHKDYGPLPISYYKEIIAKNGLRPVFVGEFGDDAYSAGLRRAFPDAEIIANGSALHDFQTLRHAHNIAVGVSTYSWMAAWLGNAKKIFYPLRGLLHPLQVPEANMVPLGDSRYKFYEFPVNDWGATAEEIRALIEDKHEAKPISQAKTKALVAQSALLAEAEVAEWKARIAEQMANT